MRVRFIRLFTPIGFGATGRRKSPISMPPALAPASSLDKVSHGDKNNEEEENSGEKGPCEENNGQEENSRQKGCGPENCEKNSEKENNGENHSL